MCQNPHRPATLAIVPPSRGMLIFRRGLLLCSFFLWLLFSAMFFSRNWVG